MKQLFLVFLITALTGCVATVPVKRNFPNVPESLKSPCTELEIIDTRTSKLSAVITIVTDNYGKYQECRIKSDAWIEWYNTQKAIFEEVK